MRLFQPKIEILARHTSETGLFPAQHLLLQVKNGLGRLGWERWVGEDFHGITTRSALMLGEVPLALLQDSGCPTCASLLAAGYGRPADDPALRALARRMNAPYRGLEDALARLSPLTRLLKSGMYFLAHGQAVPTDGEGRFFWSVPPGPEPYRATAQYYDHTNFRVLESVGWFLYPSQPADRLDGARVEYYRKKLQTGEALPPVLAFQASNAMCVLLDGHHRCAACALEGQTVPALVLCSSWICRWQDGREWIAWPAGDGDPIPVLPGWKGVPWERKDAPFPFRFSAETAPSWPEAYLRGAEKYPTAVEAAYLSLYPEAELTAEGLRALACTAAGEDGEDEVETACFLMDYASRQPGTNAKALAFAFTGEDERPDLRETACRILCRLKGDPEIEDFFVRLLVYEEENAVLRAIADRYWE
ncbi:MAG: hypothetical protein HFF50_01040 [Lawsonibacter sp.]|nr:hypothetical protein [Lawsonibacter sp.]